MVDEVLAGGEGSRRSRILRDGGPIRFVDLSYSIGRYLLSDYCLSSQSGCAVGGTRLPYIYLHVLRNTAINAACR